jgi:hypothetical protein
LQKTKILCADLVKENIMVVGTQDRYAAAAVTMSAIMSAVLSYCVVFICVCSVCMFEMVVTEESGMDIELIFSIALQSPSGSVTAVRATPGTRLFRVLIDE